VQYTFIEPQPYLTCWVALNDATPENGCPNVIPGVHRLGARLHDYDRQHNGWTVSGLATENAVCVPAKAGSIVIFSSLTPHMTGPNTTDGVRKAYICQYAPAVSRRFSVPLPVRFILLTYLTGREMPLQGVAVVGADEEGRRVATMANEPQRQYFVLKDGQPQPPPQLEVGAQ
jgi:ectoine hydroxylase-related dioxygenase (phytanoyl-CoA dioxygenase family)